MEDKKFINKFSSLFCCFAVVLIFSQCNQKDCYELQLQSSQNLKKGAPVILKDGIVGFVEEIKTSNHESVAKFCLSSDIHITKNSKIYVGLIQSFSVIGIMIELSNETDIVSSKELLRGLSMDSIEVDFSISDTVMTNKLIDIIKEKHKDQSDSTSKK